MKTSIVIFFFLSLPVAAMSQQSSANPSDGKDCPLSHWSTTGAACFYAPDIPDTKNAVFLLDSMPASSLVGYPLSEDSSHRILFIPTTVPDSIANQIRHNFDSTWDDPMQRNMFKQPVR
jgi:hypothetical protein